MNDVARYIDGDDLVPEYERTGDTNFKAYVKDIMDDDKDRNLILSYGPNKREEVENMMQNRAPSRARPSAGIMNPAR
jgi:hypothetical protein